MLQVKGMFITFTVRLMTLYKEAKQEISDYIKQQTGLDYNDLDPTAWYPGEILIKALKMYEQASPTGKTVYVTMGKQVYPIWKQNGLLPDNLKTPLDYMKYEAEGFKEAHLGPEVKQRNFIKMEDGHIIVEAPAPGYSCKLFEGVWRGIFNMIGINTAEIMQTQCVDQGDSTCVFDIKW